MYELDRRGVIPHIELIVAVAAIVAVGFAVIRIMDANSSPVASEINDSQSSELDLASINLDDVVGLETVKQAALIDNEGATVISYELESEDGVLVYKIRLDSGLELYFNATTGELIKTETSDDTEDDDNQLLPANFVAGISFNQARQIAQAERPEKKIEKIELEVEDGQVVYSIRFQDEGRVDINATTGDVVEVRQEDGERTFRSNDDDSDDDSDDDDSDDDSDDDKDEDDDEEDDDDNSGSSLSN